MLQLTACLPLSLGRWVTYDEFAQMVRSSGDGAVLEGGGETPSAAPGAASSPLCSAERQVMTMEARPVLPVLSLDRVTSQLGKARG